MSTSSTAPRAARSRAAAFPSARTWARGALAVAVTSAAFQALPAVAAPAPPVIIGPSGTVTGQPLLAWEASIGATGYEVQVDDNSNFTSPEWKPAVTTNTVSVPLEPLARGTYTVRVRARDSRAAWSDWSESSFTMDETDGPELVSPDHRAELAQPNDTPLLVWKPTTGAQSYVVELDTEPDFIDPTSYTTKSASLAVPANQSPGEEYHWRVRATLASGVFTAFSDTRTYQVFALPAPEVVAPRNGDDITDVVLEWKPVPGAKHYNLEVDDDHAFSSPVTGVPDKILGIRYSPTTTFGNGQYYWRVRAVDADGNESPWVKLADGDHHEFERVWRDTPTLVHPSDPAVAENPGTERAVQTVGDDLHYEWTPVRNASHYEVWVSTDPHFTTPSANTRQCLVMGTTYTPGELKDPCMPSTEGTVHYWKVRAFDKPYGRTGVEGIFSEPQAFIYNDKSAFTLLTPAAGATVDVPTVSWEPVDSTEKYVLEFFDATNKMVLSATTLSTSYTPSAFDLDKSSAYRVRINAVDISGNTTAIASRSFGVTRPDVDESADALMPVKKAPTYDAPSFSWSPLADENPGDKRIGTDHYRVHLRDTATPVWFHEDHAPLLSTKWEFPAATDVSAALLSDGTYEWYVTAHDKSGATLHTGPTATAKVLALPAVSGHRLALSGAGLDADDACTKSLVTGPTNWCDSVPTTPVLDWTGVPYASFYRVHVSRDNDFTSGVLDGPASTVNTRWTPRAGHAAAALPDSQANTAYHWVIQPCKTTTQCGPDPRSMVKPAQHAFRKTSPRVELITPAVQADVDSTAVRFDWKDYLATNRATTYHETRETSTQSAMSYELQVATDSTFSTVLETATVDQTTYTSAGKMYPEGPLHWRVRAIDGHGNKLGWSETRTFTKSSPAPELLAPSAGESVSLHVAFSWKPQPFASAYEIQIAANEDTSFSTANLVTTTKSTKRASWTTGIGSSPLLPSATPYVWRVRRVDAGGNRGRWTEPERFKVVSADPTPLTPLDGSTVGPRALTLTWEPVVGSTRHRVQYRKVGASTTTAAVTAATSFAPSGLVVDTDYEWQVESLDTDKRVLGQSSWRKFTIGGPPSPVVETDLAGSGTLGTDLVVTGPTWNRAGVVNTYEWLRDGEAIEDATGERYRVTVDDVGRKIRVRATGVSSEFGVGTSISNTVEGQPGAGPEATATPRISGTGAVGTTLTSTPATWRDDDVRVVHQWLRDGSEIPGATAGTYAVTAADVGKPVTLRVTGTRPGRLPTLVTSNAVRGVLGAAPRATTTPVIEGAAKVGNTLSVVPPRWDESDAHPSYQWLADGREIPNATQATYAIADDDLDRLISVRVTAEKAGYAPGSTTSASVKVGVGEAAKAEVRPTLSGAPKVGGTLSAATPWWSLPGVTTSSQWLRNGEPISGAKGPTYEPVAADFGRAISVRFTAVRPGYAPGTVDSEPVTVALGDATWWQSPATVHGAAKVGSTLTATPPTWAATGVQSSSQWLRDGRPIAGATRPTYRLAAGDLGTRISVRYVGAVPGHEDAEASSQSLTVGRGDAPGATGVEAPTGTGKVGATLRAPQVTWSLPGVTQSRQWLRDGQPISGAKGETYVVVTADAGRSLAVVTTGNLPGHAPGAVASPTVKVAAIATPPTAGKVASQATLKVAERVSAKGKAKARIKVTVKVSAKGTTATGTVKVYAGKKLVGKVKLKKGKRTLRLKSLRVGKHKLTVKYVGSRKVKASKSKKKTVRIVRR
ncbi:Ig-like domain repeat protein [Nocardioides gilvus]|uniref:Ig-like domain repeat protein n=1 Tax=Nocardioides gilvus TaxID=1735589 RepID=UPI0013A57046|nr:Ig-like domain repeat protein [Nocardioides gilvus]